MAPPHTRREAVVDTLHGVAIADPFRWLEAGDDPEVQQWVADQNRFTRTALDAIPSRGAWHERLVALMGLPVVQAVELRGDRLFLLERLAGAEQARLTVRSLRDPHGGAIVLADPGGDSADAAVAVDWFWPSLDGDLVAFGVSEGGTENSVLRIARSSDATLLADEIPETRACSLAWEPDGSGFVYTRYPAGDEYHRTVHHHTLGADWRDDPVLWAEHRTPQTWPEVRVSPEGRWALVEAMVGWGHTELHLLDRAAGEWRTLISGVEAVSEGWTFVDESTLIGTTTLDAGRGRVVRVDLDGADVTPAAWHTIVDEGDAVLGSPVPVPGGFYLPSTIVGIDQIEFVSAAGDRCAVGGLGMVSLGGLTAERGSPAAVAIVHGFDRPSGVWTISPDAPAAALFPRQADDAVPALEVGKFEYPSLDGTSVPMFLIHRAGLQPSSATPAILKGYGGFAITESPVWSPMIAAWCAAGGLYAIAGLRGGTEYGDHWHRAGRRANKQNVFDDFAAAADWLVANGRTSRHRLAIAGGSNGGLLVGAALTQRPDLCRAAWCAVPLLDMVRFPQFLIARLWTDEYGDPDVADEFAWLHAYSPYHHVIDGERYPAVLLTTAEGDSRVDPMHARKMAAMLQACASDQDERPIFLHQEGRAGHGVGKPVGKRADEYADVLAFFDTQLAR